MEVFLYVDFIKKRKLNDLMIQLAIAQNPHTKNPKELWERLNKELRFLQPESMMDIYPEAGAFDKIAKILPRVGKGKNKIKGSNEGSTKE